MTKTPCAECWKKKFGNKPFLLHAGGGTLNICQACWIELEYSEWFWRGSGWN